MIRKRDLAQVARTNGVKIHNQIQSGNFIGLQDTMNLICRTITNTDEFINDEFVNAIVKEVYGEFGGDQLIASERGYPIDFKPQEKTTMSVVTACGSEIEINSVKCNMPYSSEVFNQYYDYLVVNKQKTLPVSITQNELRKISCGEDTFSQLRSLILAKVTESIEAYIRDEIYCILNNPQNYKTIEELTYTCDSCEGDSFISALTQFAINLQINAKNYNLAGRTYDLPIKSKAWLLNSTKLASKLASRYAQGGTNASYIDISTKFARVFDIPQLKIADGVIMDSNWLQVRKVFTELVWKYEPSARSECGVYNLDMKIKPVNFFTAVPFKLIEVTKEEKKSAHDLALKIEAFKKEYTITDEDDAKTQIETDINALNTSQNPKLELNYDFSSFKTPNGGNGSIIVKTTILNAEGVKLNKTVNKFILKKKGKLKIDIDTSDIYVESESPVNRVINNFDVLENLTATSGDETIAIASLEEMPNNLTIKPVSNGTTTCTLTADNAETLSIDVVIQY